MGLGPPGLFFRVKSSEVRMTAQRLQEQLSVVEGKNSAEKRPFECEKARIIIYLDLQRGCPMEIPRQCRGFHW